MVPQDVVDAVKEAGTMQPLEGYIKLKRMEAAVAEALAELKDAAIAAASQYGKGEHEAFGAIIQCRAGGGRWDFKHLPWYTNLDMLMKSKQEMAKAAYNAQQKMQPLPVDLETGEQVEPAVYMPGAETVSISLKKK